jgi:hypothetical protein
MEKTLQQKNETIAKMLGWVYFSKSVFYPYDSLDLPKEESVWVLNPTEQYTLNPVHGYLFNAEIAGAIEDGDMHYYDDWTYGHLFNYHGEWSELMKAVRFICEKITNHKFHYMNLTVPIENVFETCYWYAEVFDVPNLEVITTKQFVEWLVTFTFFDNDDPQHRDIFTYITPFPEEQRQIKIIEPGVVIYSDGTVPTLSLLSFKEFIKNYKV